MNDSEPMGIQEACDVARQGGERVSQNAVQQAVYSLTGDMNDVYRLLGLRHPNGYVRLRTLGTWNATPWEYRTEAERATAMNIARALLNTE